MESTPNFGQCRCCLSKGRHRYITEHSNEAKENYSKLILDCFNLSLSKNPKLTPLICSSCISKLHEAMQFKTLVMQSEQHLLAALGSAEPMFINMPAIEDQITEDINIKEEAIKTEPEVHVTYSLDDDDLEAAYQDEELMKLEENDEEMSENGHEEPDVLEASANSTNECDEQDTEHIEIEYEDLEKLLMSMDAEEPSDQEKFSSEEDTPLIKEFLSRFQTSELPRLPTSTSLQELCPEYARFLNILSDKTITAEMISKQLDDPHYFYNLFNIMPTTNDVMPEKDGIIANIDTLISNSNIAPFRTRNRVMRLPCYYCSAAFQNIKELRDHQNQQHDRKEFKKVASTRYQGSEKIVVNVDVTDLKCTICNNNVPNLAELQSHLIKVHNKHFYGYSNRVVPYKLSENDVYECQICSFTFETFGTIERHMNGHLRNYVCITCGAGFVSKYRLKLHVKVHEVEGTHTCSTCSKTFASSRKLKSHIDAVHKMLKRFKCSICPVRFSDYLPRQKHMVMVHNMTPIKYKCNVCDKGYDRKYALSIHMKRDHLAEKNFQCESCLYQCHSMSELKSHMVKHKGEKVFECEVCKKSYARKKTLREHMRIHNNDRRFVCTVCGVTFVQKCSLKGHIKTHHQEFGGS